MNLLDQFRALSIEDRDILHILTYAAQGATVRTGPNKFNLSTRNNFGADELYATIRHKKDGCLSEIMPGSGLQSTEAQNILIERARSEALADHGSIIQHRVIFSQVPLKGEVVGNDIFRLRPCPARIGTGKSWYNSVVPMSSAFTENGPPFPLLLDVRIPRSTNPLLEASRILRSLDHYQYLLTLLITGITGPVHWPAGRIWVALRATDGAPEYHLVDQSFGTSEDAPADPAKFSNTGLNAAPEYRGDNYYSRLWQLESEIHVPDTLGAHLGDFASLSSINQKRFMRACYWYAVGLQSLNQPSQSIIAFSAAIESLLPRPRNINCGTCGKPTGPGPTHLFKKHIGKYGIVSEQLHGQRDALYAVRSALVHGSHASHVDTDPLSFYPDKDRSHLLLMTIVTQRSLINWLADPAKCE